MSIIQLQLHHQPGIFTVEKKRHDTYKTEKLSKAKREIMWLVMGSSATLALIWSHFLAPSEC